MAETLLQFETPVKGPDGALYEARACGDAMPGGGWQGWIEFVPFAGGRPLRSQRETTQPNRVDTQYWASGLTPVYLEGALRRALTPPIAVVATRTRPSIFDAPAPSGGAVEVPVSSVLNPFSVYEKGEKLLRVQLSALAEWHLVNIALEYRLTDENVQSLNRLPKPALIETITRAVRERLGVPSGTAPSTR